MPSLRSTGLIHIYTGNGKGKTTAALGLALRAVGAGKRVAIVFFDKGGEHYSERKILASLGINWFAYGLDRINPKTNRFRFGVLTEDVAAAEQGIAKALELTRLRHPEGAQATKGSRTRPRSPSEAEEERRGEGLCPALRDDEASDFGRGGGPAGTPGGVPALYDLLILDEINTVVALGMVNEKAVERLIEMKPETLELVLTGRTEVTRASASSRAAGEGSRLSGKPWPDGNEQQRWLSYFDRADLITEMQLVKHYFYEGIPTREGFDY